MHAALLHRRGHMVGTRHDVRDDLGLRRIRDGRLEDTHDGHRAVTESHGLSDDRFVALQSGGPEAMGDHHGARSLGPVVGRAEQSPQHGTESHDVEVRPVDDSGANHARFAQPDHRKVDGGELAEGGHRFDALAKAPDFRYGKGGILHANTRRILTNVHEPIFIAIDERARRTPRTTLKIAALTPIPSARVNDLPLFSSTTRKQKIHETWPSCNASTSKLSGC